MTTRWGSPHYTDSSREIIRVETFKRSLWPDTFNLVRLKFNLLTSEGGELRHVEKIATESDMSNITAQGKVRPADFHYPYVTQAALAQTLAARELSTLMSR